MENLKVARYNYNNICENLLKDLPERTASVIMRRFGFDRDKKETLELIGESYGITRERVRQIEKEGILKIRPKVKDYPKLFSYFKELIKSLGGIKREKELIDLIGRGKNQNQISFLLGMSQDLNFYPEDESYHSFWAKDPKTADLVKKVIDFCIKKFEEMNKSVNIEEFLNIQKADIYKAAGKNMETDVLNSYLEISKNLKKNPEGQIGLINWIEINPKNIKDIAYLIIRKEGKSLHFSKVADLIQKSPYFLKNKIHVATVHNELIKDERFVLVGRGLYALKEWGYEPGVVKDIIIKVLREGSKPMTKNEILEGVLKQRVVKANTVFLNLQNKKCFLRDSQGNYTIHKEA